MENIGKKQKEIFTTISNDTEWLIYCESLITMGNFLQHTSMDNVPMDSLADINSFFTKETITMADLNNLLLHTHKNYNIEIRKIDNISKDSIREGIQLLKRGLAILQFNRSVNFTDTEQKEFNEIKSQLLNDSIWKKPLNIKR